MLLQALCIISNPPMNSNWSYTSETPNLGQNQRFCLAVPPCNLTYDLENNRAPLLRYFELCASYLSHWWIQTVVTVRKRPIWVKFDHFLEPCDLAIRRMTLKNNRAPFLSNIKLYTLLHHHMWIQTGVTVRKPLSWPLWPWPLTSHLDLLHGPYPGHW